MSLAPMDLLQDGLVTAIALGAMAILFRRVVGFARPPAGASPACANCPSAARACNTDTSPSAVPQAAEHPLVFVRPSQQ